MGAAESGEELKGAFARVLWRKEQERGRRLAAAGVWLAAGLGILFWGGLAAEALGEGPGLAGALGLEAAREAWGGSRALGAPGLAAPGFFADWELLAAAANALGAKVPFLDEAARLAGAAKSALWSGMFWPMAAAPAGVLALMWLWPRGSLAESVLRYMENSKQAAAAEAERREIEQCSCEAKAAEGGRKMRL